LSGAVANVAGVGNSAGESAETAKLRQVGPFLLERGLKVTPRYRFLQKTCNV
jgi:hypothetical protein